MDKDKIKPNFQEKNSKEIPTTLEKDILHGTNSFNSLKEERSFRDLVNKIQTSKRNLDIPFYGSNIYEWNRGVIGIEESGRTIKENLDVTDSHHAVATIRITRQFGKEIETTISPFEAGLESTKEGIIIIQTEKDCALIYFPNQITNEQFESLKTSLEPRANYSFSLIYQNRIIDEVNIFGIIELASSIIEYEEITNQIHR